MSEILSKVLAQSEPVKLGTDHFMDDIMVQESIVTAEEVAVHLQQYGLVTKPPESLDGGRVLGLEPARDSRRALQFSRGNEVPTVDPSHGGRKRPQGWPMVVSEFLRFVGVNVTQISKLKRHDQ